VKRPSDAARADAGFSLIEVLIAMVILSVGLLALEGLSIGAARVTAHASRRSLYTEQATDALERSLSALREGQAVAGGDADVKNASGQKVATLTLSTASTALLTSPAVPMRRWDVTVRVIPVKTADRNDSVNVVGSVIQQ
jgi:type IV pilus modification protein PilV